MICFYHNADLDGQCSAAIVKMANPKCELYGINYGDPFPWKRIHLGECVYMVDFSLQPFSEMERLNEWCRLIWIDHHKTAIEEAKERGVVASQEVLDVNFAACELAWTHFFPKDAIPLAVTYLGRYDVWQWQDMPGALEFQYGMKPLDTRPENQELWQQLFANEPIMEETPCELVRKDGALILQYEGMINARLCASYAFETVLDGLRCIAVNRPMCNSRVFESVWDMEKHDAMLTFAMSNDGLWMVSLYSDKPDIDVGTVCKAHGGGGHRGAAGFQCLHLPFHLP